MDTTDGAQGLFDRARGGDDDAFERLVARYRPRLESLIRLRLGRQLQRRVDVDDVLQETLLQAFRAMPDFEWRGTRQFVVWLSTIAERTCSNLVRKHVLYDKESIRREVSLQRPLAGEPSGGAELGDLLAAPQTGPSAGLRREERLTRFERAIDELPPRYREVLVLSLVQRIPTREVGRRLDLSPSAVCMLRSRALAKLRELFGDTESFHLPERPAIVRPDVGPRDPSRDSNGKP